MVWAPGGALTHACFQASRQSLGNHSSRARHRGCNSLLQPGEKMKFKIGSLVLSLMTLTSIAVAGECAKTGPGMRLSQGGVFMVRFDLKDKAGGKIASAQEKFDASTFVFDFVDCNGAKFGSVREQMSGSFTNPYGTYKFFD